jgi:hypothetical protein
MPIARALLILALLSAASAEAQSSASVPTAADLEGAWTRVTSIAANGTETPSPPGIRTFVGGHYSWVQAPANRPRIDSTATAAQLRAVWGPVTANSGRYEVVGHTMTQRPLVDRVPEVMASGVHQTFAIRLAADTMWITQISNSLTAGPLPNAGTGKYVRVR